MNDENSKNLIEELIKEGASENQAQELSLLSKNISNLYKLKRSDNFKNRFIINEGLPGKTDYISKKVFLSVFLSIVLLLGFASVVSAQNSLPGDPLYPVKRLSENVILIVNPSFKNEMLKRRSREIQALSAKNQNTNFNKTINDYEKELNSNGKLNIQAIKESDDNLEQAKNKSIDGNRKQIENAIQQTDTAKENIDKLQNQNEENFQNSSGSGINSQQENMSTSQSPINKAISP